MRVAACRSIDMDGEARDRILDWIDGCCSMLIRSVNGGAISHGGAGVRCRLDAVGAKTNTGTDTDTDAHADKHRSDDGGWRARTLGEGREGARRLGMYSKMEDEWICTSITSSPLSVIHRRKSSTLQHQSLATPKEQQTAILIDAKSSLPSTLARRPPTLFAGMQGASARAWPVNASIFLL